MNFTAPGLDSHQNLAVCLLYWEVKLANRGLSDEEIGLIKAMLIASMPAQDICGYMFRPNRSLNPAGVYEIKAGKRGASIPPHNPDNLEAWLKNHPYFGTMATADIISDLRKEVRGILRPKKEEGVVKVDPKETSRVEFKETFHLKSFAEYARSLIGYANHKGGFVVFGIADNQTVTGLQNNSFKTLDPQKASTFLKDLVTPTVRWGTFVMTLLDIEVGVLFAEEAEIKPLITIKNADKIKENTIYFRYEAETAVIRAGDLQAIIQQREQMAIQTAISKLQQISGIGLDNSEVVDVKSNRSSLEKEIIAKAISAKESDIIVKKSGISDLDILVDFINEESVHPISYLLQSAHETVRWLPLFYYANLSTLSLDTIIDEISKSPVSKPGTIRHIKQRLNGEISAYQAYTGAAPPGYLKMLEAGAMPDLKDRAEARRFAMCLMGAPDNVAIEPALMRLALKKMVECYQKFKRDAAIGSSMRRSAARVDELIYKSKPIASKEVDSFEDLLGA